VCVWWTWLLHVDACVACRWRNTCIPFKVPSSWHCGTMTTVKFAVSKVASHVTCTASSVMHPVHEMVTVVVEWSHFGMELHYWTFVSGVKLVSSAFYDKTVSFHNHVVRLTVDVWFRQTFLCIIQLQDVCVCVCVYVCVCIYIYIQVCPHFLNNFIDVQHVPLQV
jgi:hypothetical protein